MTRFKISAEIRPVGDTSPYRDFEYASTDNDVQRHMIRLQEDGYEVLNICSKPYYDKPAEGVAGELVEEEDMLPPDELVDTPTYAEIMKETANGVATEDSTANTNTGSA